MEQIRIAAHIRADHPNAVFFQLAQRPRQIGHGDIRHGFRRSAGYFAHGGVQPGAFVFRGDDGVHAHGIRRPQARAQIVRVGNAVQHQQKRGFAQIFQHVFQMNVVFGRINKADNALVARAFAHGVQAVGIGKMHAHAFGGGLFQNLARAGIVFVFQHIQFCDGFRVLPQARIDGVKTVN